MGSKQKRKLARAQREIIRWQNISYRVNKELKKTKALAVGLGMMKVTHFARGCETPTIVSYDSFMRAMRQLPPTGRESRRPMGSLVLQCTQEPMSAARRRGPSHCDPFKAITLSTGVAVVPSLGKRDERVFGWMLPPGILLIDMEPRSETY